MLALIILGLQAAAACTPNWNKTNKPIHSRCGSGRVVAWVLFKAHCAKSGTPAFFFIADIMTRPSVAHTLTVSCLAGWQLKSRVCLARKNFWKKILKVSVRVS
jgi:hypothetical protein